MVDYLCPLCYSFEHIISDGNSSASGACGKRGSFGERTSFWYCTNCFTEFSVKVKYKQLKTDKRIGQTGWTGYQG